LDWNYLAKEAHAAKGIIKRRQMSLAVEKTPRIRLSCKLVPFKNREYENSLLDTSLSGLSFLVLASHIETLHYGQTHLSSGRSIEGGHQLHYGSSYKNY